MTPEQINPPAMIQAAFDEAQALAECRELIARRDEAKGEFKDAILLLGQRLIAARKAMPGATGIGGKENYSVAFKAFLEKVGLATNTASTYMSYARNPARLAAQRSRDSQRARRTKVLTEVAELLAQAPDLDTARRVIQEELNAIG